MVIAGLLAALLVTPAAAAKRGRTPSRSTMVTLAQADSLYRHQDWAHAADAYAAYLERHADVASAWSSLGSAQIHLKRYRDAIRSLGQADSLGPDPTAQYNLACAHALSGDSTRAFGWLRKAIDSDFARPELIEQDADLAALRGTRGFAAAVQYARDHFRPCPASTELLALAAWTGAWEVRHARGDVAGTSQVERSAADCAILEEWHPVGEPATKSFLVYNRTKKKWQQMSMDERGRVAELSGDLKDGALVLEGYRETADGKRMANRITVKPVSADEVRRVIEDSPDGGGTWIVTANLVYRRKAS